MYVIHGHTCVILTTRVLSSKVYFSTERTIIKLQFLFSGTCIFLKGCHGNHFFKLTLNKLFDVHLENILLLYTFWLVVLLFVLLLFFFFGSDFVLFCGPESQTQDLAYAR
jgi:hypothetical protein